MGEQSAISWTDIYSPVKAIPALRFAQIADTVWFEMLPFVTQMAKCNTVGNLKSQFWVSCEWLNVVSAKIATGAVTTVLACVAISRKNLASPRSVFGRYALAVALYRLAINVCGRKTSSQNLGAISKACADCRALFSSSWYTSFWARFSFLFSAEQRLSLSGMCLALKPTWATFCRNANFNSRAFLALGRCSVIARSIFIKFKKRSPFSAFPTPFFSTRDSLLKFKQRHAGLCGDAFLSPFMCLCHARYFIGDC